MSSRIQSPTDFLISMTRTPTQRTTLIDNIQSNGTAITASVVAARNRFRYSEERTERENNEYNCDENSMSMGDAPRAPAVLRVSLGVN